MGIFDAIGIDAGIVLIIVILIQLVLIFFLVKQSMKLARLTNKYKMFMRGKEIRRSRCHDRSSKISGG